VSTVAERGNSNAISDVGVAALLASAACTGACYNVRVNASALRDSADAERAVDEAIALSAETEALAASVAERVCAAI
jgi:formiminotetrahydrofolate cyclodeaminase